MEKCQDIEDVMQKETDSRSVIDTQSHHFMDQVHLCDVCVSTHVCSLPLKHV